MYRDICPSIVFEEEYREGFMVAAEDAALGDDPVDTALVSEYGYYGLGYKDGLEISKLPKNTSSEYYNQ